MNYKKITFFIMVIVALAFTIATIFFKFDPIAGTAIVSATLAGLFKFKDWIRKKKN